VIDPGAAKFVASYLQNPKNILVFMSDHGNGNEGWKRPLLTMYIPKWLLKKYPEYYDNLRYNQQKVPNFFTLPHLHLSRFW
jgi:hypothetical protein